MESLKQIASLVSFLDRDLADQLLDHLDREDADAVRSAVLGISQSDEIDERAAIKEFLDVDAEYLAATETPIEKARPESKDDGLDQLLARATNELLSRLLCKELSQTSAIILARLPASRASEIVSTLPPQSQPDILQRIVEIDNLNLRNASFMQSELENWLRLEIETGVQRVELISRMANVVESASSSAQIRILENVAAYDSTMAQQLRDQFGLDLE